MSEHSIIETCQISPFEYIIAYKIKSLLIQNGRELKCEKRGVFRVYYDNDTHKKTKCYILRHLSDNL